MIGLAVWVVTVVCAADQPSGLPPLIQRGSRAVTYYYLSPNPRFAVELLDDVLKKENLDHAWFRARPEVLRIIATSVGFIARGNPEIVRYTSWSLDDDNASQALQEGS